MKFNIKSLSKIALGVSGLFFLSGCNDSFMDRFPETNITEKVFFTSVSDLETYTNGMYGYIGSSYWDVASDNVLYCEDAGVYKKMRGEIDPSNVGSWSGSWENIRSINFMLARTGQVKGDKADINHYIGLAKMFRAQLYYSLVKSYSDVPWYGSDLQTTDLEQLYKKQDSRELVVDSIMADLDFAVKNMKDGASKTRIFKSVALAIQARIALNEGTFRKYHKELNLNDGDRFLNIAADASKKIMDSKKYTLCTSKQGTIEPYEGMFCSLDLSQNPEMILIGDYDKTLGRLHNAQSIFDWTTGLSRDLMEDYLTIEAGKTKPFHDVAGYETKTLNEIFENRDPRLVQTFMKPGYVKAGSTDAFRQKLTLGGYVQLKFHPRTYDQLAWDKSYTDLPIIRYAEILLMYAEAKAELGTLTQADLDASINLIRARVGVPAASLTDWLSNIDPVQTNRYSNVVSSQKGAILEVRRERRIELACEGFRYGDLMRWSCGKLMEKTPEGSYIPGYGYQDITGDGIPDVAIVATKADADKISAADKEKYKLTVYILEGNTIELTQGNKGYIRLVSQVNKFTFIEPKYYYTPMYEQDMLVNKNLVQNKYWLK